MVNEDACRFCHAKNFTSRFIGGYEFCYAIISDPSWRAGQCLVIPRRHVLTLDELTWDEGAEIMQELGRLSRLLDAGYGTGIMQKFQPDQPENGIKVNHLHFHVFPRLPGEDTVRLFPVPEPNSFAGFRPLLEEERLELTARLQP